LSAILGSSCSVPPYPGAHRTINERSDNGRNKSTDAANYDPAKVEFNARGLIVEANSLKPIQLPTLGTRLRTPRISAHFASDLLHSLDPESILYCAIPWLLISKRGQCLSNAEAVRSSSSPSLPTTTVVLRRKRLSKCFWNQPLN
jgi:hypothetical protein